MSAALRLAAIVPLAIAACFVHRKSDELACTVSADCADANQVCSQGFCVMQDKSGCPDHCATCDTTVTPHVCTVTSTNGKDFTCPSGFHCELACTADACGDITCDADSQCTISCAGNKACGIITCDQACACDVTCTGGGCMDIHCPHQGSKYCTPDQTDTGACTSASGGRCNSC